MIAELNKKAKEVLPHLVETVSVIPQRGGYAVEMGRETALELFAVLTETALQHGAALSYGTTARLEGDRVLAECVLTLQAGDVRISRTGLGEALLADKQGPSEIAVRAAETRAIKRAIAGLVPAVDSILRRWSEWVAAYAAKAQGLDGLHPADRAAKLKAALVAAVCKQQETPNGTPAPQPQLVARR